MTPQASPEENPRTPSTLRERRGHRLAPFTSVVEKQGHASQPVISESLHPLYWVGGRGRTEVPLTSAGSPVKISKGTIAGSSGTRALDFAAAWVLGGQVMNGEPVLVVDDDPYLLNLIVDVLKIEGYPVVAAKNGAEAIRAISDTRPSVVLLDMQMPILDGWEFVQLVRNNGLKFPIVIMSGSHNAAGWAAEVGAEDYLGKPFELDDLTAKIAQFQDVEAGP
jgi:CheY-like chemotaxis protein